MNTINHISSLLRQIDFKFQEKDGRITAKVAIDDDQSFDVAITLQVDGDVINFEFMNLLSKREVVETEHQGAFLGYILQQNWNTASGAIELDTDGEVRVVMEVPMADVLMSVDQIKLIFTLMGSQVKSLLAEGRSILRTGKAKNPSDGSEDSVKQNLAEAYLAMVRMSQSTRGRAELAEILRNENLPPVLRALAVKLLSDNSPEEL